ncbi:NAD(P)(+) transhydrogenase (Re/Si-specific) subunit beta [Cellulophaga baltica]|uniref:NAD(P)(+) transhydrogenase (Re/Si-specific) subunit beta n=1 Tax=Cellulophaga TaxID=104264 RepID=UPI001C066B3B|nr:MULTISPECIES: NAD(P)(+) transhydrogenase (Re/Si-specific) subunit beta [Cellulophaga]MBU2997844.1 NAD(P)(+) transhydrogenase (Re/Si-specific) subunit beta [Cellulophaga baltica]MDO6769243.1 NAD(P)(+) transhydrogenase (Re/Si-specific) subunit beta [Cellulophaga sp. 1_MG-2023]
MLSTSLLLICYLVGSVAFILGLKMLSSPKTALNGNRLAAVGMLIAIGGTFLFYRNSNGEPLGNLIYIFIAIAIGATIGTLGAKKVKMTAMPQLVSLFNGAGGLCASLISIVEFNRIISSNTINQISTGFLLILIADLLIGSVSFSGSMIAFAKLNGNIKKVTSFTGQQFINFGILILIIFLAVLVVNGSVNTSLYFYAIFSLALVYGVLFVVPIGGADMPVVISLLNSFTGIATAFAGFLYSNQAMMTGGILVGSAGTILTLVMCRAMNRSLSKVLLGSFGAKKTATGESAERDYKEISVSDTAMIMNYAHKVMIVPGYGLAVAQAQHACHDLDKILTDKGIEVSYAIHPVAGRMPGHMNVLLAEANVPYDELEEMEPSNDEFPHTDVVLVLGANDVVNPAAENDPASPIYGMQILEVDKAKQVIVNKRTMHPGYAGISNALFYEDNTSMLFGDAKNVLEQIITEIKSM